ncbi:hypothetical protein DE146DRAFT_740009 [Phaeosphaeria sp. MPI-PUGE-AT-0046c]|nr:hypothetical protein DE146DRAFT_740009 [Phaeosphaeria sp. MPI-PUGE-AT-0046c]
MRLPFTSEAVIGALLATSVSAYLTDPPTTASSDTISDCSGWEVAGADSTCKSIADKWFITAEYFAYYNPSTAAKCNLIVGNSYCTEQDWGIPHPIPSSTSSSVPTPTKPSNGIVTPSPIQDGMTENCNKFYTVIPNDGCWAIANSNSIELDDFYKWNPAVKNDCSKLQPKFNVCVGIIGGAQPSPSPTAGPTASSVKPTPTNGIATPSPIQSGMVTNCNKFYYVKSGDGCWAIATDAGITTDQFGAYNPAVGADCKGLFPDKYVCVGIVGSTTTKPTTSSTTVVTTPKPTPTNGVNTPSPIQTGMVTNCNKFYLVKSGDGCWDIATSNGITTDQFATWNPAVGADCKGLFPTNYVCISIIGLTAPITTMKTSTIWVQPPLCTFNLSKGQYVCPTAGPTTTTKPTTTTTKTGNGIATPTPIQSGMTGNCKKFYKVVSGDGCWAISQAQKIDLNNFYSWNTALNVGGECKGLQAGVWVCIGV